MTGLRVVAVGLPFAAALAAWRLGDQNQRARRRLAAIVLILVGLIALTLFFVTGHVACTFATGKQNCLFNGFGELTLAALCFVLARGALKQHGAAEGRDSGLRLALAGGWAGVALGDNFLLLFIALQVFLFVLIRWLRARGYQPEFMVVRDDYKDDHGPK